MGRLDRTVMAGDVDTFRLAHKRIVSRKSGMHPPQSARSDNRSQRPLHFVRMSFPIRVTRRT